MKLLIAAALLATTPALAQNAQPKSFVDHLVEAIRPQVPMALEGGFAMTEVRAEGRILVVAIEDREDQAGSISPADAARDLAEGMASGFCSDKTTADKMFDAGYAIRADIILVDGRRVTGPIIDRCP